MSNRLIYIFIIILSFCFMFITGCKVGPSYSRPETIAQTHEDEGFIFAGSHDEDVNDFSQADKWWENFGDSVTVELVQEALENNYDLKAAAARVLQAQASLVEARGMQWPEISYGLSGDQSKISFNLGDFAGGGRFTVLSTTWTQNISATYILDLFGKLKRLEKAAWADMFALKTNELALTNSIIASVILSRVNIAIAQRQLALLRANIESQQRTLDIVESRYEQGLVGILDVKLARGTLAALKSAEPALELQLITASNAMDVILARRPGASEQLPETLDDLPQLDRIPIGLPASLLDRRPDVKAAEFSLIAANERVGVSIAQLYPDLALTGRFGYSGDTLEEIFKYDYTEMYTAVINLSQPIFNGGRIRAQIDAAKARYEELAANYAQVVLNAIREVEDALVTEQKLQAQLEQAEISFSEAKAAEELSRQMYENGVQGILAVLEAERQSRTAEQELAVLKGQIWSARVNLHLALGGNWNSTEREVAVKK